MNIDELLLANQKKEGQCLSRLDSYTPPKVQALVKTAPKVYSDHCCSWISEINVKAS